MYGREQELDMQSSIHSQGRVDRTVGLGMQVSFRKQHPCLYPYIGMFTAMSTPSS